MHEQTSGILIREIKIELAFEGCLNDEEKVD